MSSNETCSYISPDGPTCSHVADSVSGLCFWHDPAIDKNGEPLKKQMEELARSGACLHGLQLQGADLEDVDLVNRGCNEGFDLSYSDFYHAHLKGAHLFGLKLQHGSLMKADLSEANLHCCDFEDTNLLGVKWYNARIDSMHIGKQLLQERIAFKERRRRQNAEAVDNFEQCEEIYRDLRKAAETQGLFEMGGYFIHKELTMRRFQYPILSARRFVSKFIDIFCGYGEKPLNVILFSILFIFICAGFYFMLGVNAAGGEVGFDPSVGWGENFRSFLTSVYYSVVTFTTLGYGDITPVGPARAVAAIEAFIGSFTLALFVVVFVKKMTR